MKANEEHKKNRPMKEGTTEKTASATVTVADKRAFANNNAPSIKKALDKFRKHVPSH